MGLGRHFVVEPDQQVTDGGRDELAGGDLDRRGGEGSPAMSGLGRLMLGGVILGAAGGAGHGERQAVSCRSGSVALGRNRISMVTADVTPYGCARIPLGEQSGRCGAHRAAARVCGGVSWRLDELHCGGQVHRPAGADDVRMGACSGSAPPSARRPRCGSAAR